MKYSFFHRHSVSSRNRKGRISRRCILFFWLLVEKPLLSHNERIYNSHLIGIKEEESFVVEISQETMGPCLKLVYSQPTNRVGVTDQLNYLIGLIGGIVSTLLVLPMLSRA